MNSNQNNASSPLELEVHNNTVLNALNTKDECRKGLQKIMKCACEMLNVLKTDDNNADKALDGLGFKALKGNPK